MNIERYRLPILALLLAFAVDSLSQDVQVTATVDSETLGMQDQLQLTIRISGDGDAGGSALSTIRLRGSAQPVGR
jgi:hypothetical protein